MKTGIGFLKVDLVIQKILGSIYLITGLLGFVIHGLLMIAMLTQLVIGGWQVLSALVIIAIRRDKKRIFYLLAVLGYFACLALGSYLTYSNIINEHTLFAIFGLVIIPILFGLSYYMITLKDYLQILNNPAMYENFDLDMEEILDSDEVVRNYSVK